jgi:hypothetical protein
VLIVDSWYFHPAKSFNLAAQYDFWCGDINERAATALISGRTNIAVANMATAIPVSQLSKYPCRTQDEEEPSFGVAPVSNFAGTTGELAPDEPDDLVLGYGTIVPRWDVKQAGGRKLEYYVQVESFPSADKAKIAADTFQKAANSWNELDIGIVISKTTDQSSANFYLVYKVNTQANINTLASAFFPHEIDQDVIVYKRSFDADGLAILKNIFQHEIGHILGLRHEFAITGDPDKGLRPEDAGPVQFLENNYNSIMSYNFPPKIQDSDREQVSKFYELPNGFKVVNSPITDFIPRIRRGKVTPS